jgi:hypothetical protein
MKTAHGFHGVTVLESSSRLAFSYHREGAGFAVGYKTEDTAKVTTSALISGDYGAHASDIHD